MFRLIRALVRRKCIKGHWLTPKQIFHSYESGHFLIIFLHYNKNEKFEILARVVLYIFG